MRNELPVLSPGSRLGPYEIISLLGAGGMGEVYRARDSALRRDVAVKVLPDALASDPERLARFQREAEILAALNHPNIAHIHGLHESDNVRALVMELVEGSTLADRIAAGAVPLAESLAIATQIAEALEAAHDRGIIHRDLKPANIKIRNDGTVKVLDFGLAKAATSEASPDLSQSPTITLDGTRAGVVLGTAAYMSPEQARGRPLDKRTDIWSFGCVLFEMLAGRAAFTGETVTDISAAIIGRDPDWDRLPASTPRAIRQLLKRCLQKDARQRLRDIGDARLELRDSAALDAAEVAVGTVRNTRLPLSIAAGAVIVALLAFVLGLWRGEVQKPAAESPLASATFTRLTDFEGTEYDADLSDDGRFVVFRSDRDGPVDVWLTQVGSGRFTNLTQGKEDVSGIVNMVGFTPDASEITVGSPNPTHRLRLIPLLGGAARAFLPGSVVSIDWSPDRSRIVYHSADSGDPMFVADRTGGSVKQIYIHPQPGGHNHYPIWSPDGNSIFFVTGNWATTQMDLWRIAPSGGIPERFTNHNNNVTYPTSIDARTLLYLSPADDGSGPWMWALDLSTKATRRVSFGLEKYTSLAATADGHRLVATVSNPTANLWSVRIQDRVATEADAKPFPLPTVRALAPRVGAASLFYLSSLGTGDGLWRYEDGQAAEIWKGADGALLEPPAVSPDGRRVALVLRRGGKRQLHVMAADGAQLQPVADALDVQGAACWSPDGKWIVTGAADTSGLGLFKVAVDDGTHVRLVSGPALNPVWSPDGTLIVFAGPLVGQHAALLAVDPDGRTITLPQIQVRTEGERARFTPDGRSLVYMVGPYAGQDFWLLDLATKKTRALTDLKNSAMMRTFDITSDGKQIVFDRMRTNSDLVLIDLPRQ